MAERFVSWSDFVAGYADEVRHAREVHAALTAEGLSPDRPVALDFIFVSDRREKLERLRSFLAGHYPYTDLEHQTGDEGPELQGTTDPLALSEDALLYWALDMAKRGFEHDARLDGYGARLTRGGTAEPPLDRSAAAEPIWIDRGIEQYAAGNLSGAQISWSHAIAINPRNADALASRAILRAELFAWRAALADYDAALAIAPNDVRARLNRGALRDDHGDHAGALADYEHLLGLAGLPVATQANAHLNAGNSHFALGDRAAACAAWRRALALGAEDARVRIAEQCGASAS